MFGLPRFALDLLAEILFAPYAADRGVLSKLVRLSPEAAVIDAAPAKVQALLKSIPWFRSILGGFLITLVTSSINSARIMLRDFWRLQTAADEGL